MRQRCAKLYGDTCVNWGAESTVAVLVKHSTSPVTLAKKEAAAARAERYADLILFKTSVYFHGVMMLFGLLSGCYSAYFNKNTIQTCVCVQW